MNTTTWNIGKAETIEDIRGILDLQKRNLAVNFTPDQMRENGYVTLKHNEDLLWRMNQEGGHIVLKHDGVVKAYALFMPMSFMPEVEHLEEVFNLFETISWNGKLLKELNYCFMGQICVDESVRGQGVFRQLYKAFGEAYKNEYEYCLTLIALRNLKSHHAHTRVGFETAYVAALDDYEPWELVAWNMRE